MQILNENGKTYLKGIITEANCGTNKAGTDFSFRGRNRNGRLYPFDILKESVLELSKRVNEANGVLSYLNHPPHSNLIYKDSCAKIVELEWIDESGRAHGKLEILEDTKSGKEVLKNLKAGKPYGISTRGEGSLDEDKKVQKGLKLITADIIPQFNGSIQSCQSCNLSLTESIQSDYEDYLIETDKSCGCIYAKLDKSDKVIAENYVIEKFSKLFANLNK